MHLDLMINNEAVEKDIVVTESAQRFACSNETETFIMDISGKETEEGAFFECALYRKDDNGNVTFEDVQFSQVFAPVVVAACDEPATVKISNGPENENFSLTLTARK